MIRHVIMWKFVDELDGMNKEEIMDKVTECFVHLKNVIPEDQVHERGKRRAQKRALIRYDIPDRV